MSVSIPSNVPRWADNGGAIVEPSAGKKDVGWIGDPPDQPPAQYFNWWMNLAYLWILVVQKMVQTLTRRTRIGSRAAGTWEFALATNATTFVTRVATGGSPATWIADIPLEAGERLLAVRAYIHELVTSGTRAKLAVATLDATGTDTLLGSTFATGSGAADRTITVDLTSTPYTQAATTLVACTVNLITDHDVLYFIEYDVDRISYT
jgi:hypothetical protein